MKQIVVDASVAVAWGLEDEKGSYAREVLEALKEAEGLAPEALMLEVVNSVLRAERSGRISMERTAVYLRELEAMGLKLDGGAADAATTRLLDMGRRHGLSAHDAAYLELAERTGSLLATQDRDLAKAARSCGVGVYAGARRAQLAGED